MQNSASARCEAAHRESLRAILDRERSRADRTGGEFSVIYFALEDGAGIAKRADRLLAYLEHRSRCIDEIGCEGTSLVWFVLPNCPGPSAMQLAEGIRHSLLDQEISFEYDVHHYNGRAPIELPHPGNRQTGGEDEGSGTPPAGSLERETRHRREHHGSFHEAPVRPLADLLVCSRPVWKRLLDLLAAGVGLVLCAPVFVAVALAIKVFSPGPVFFRQLRSGRKGRPFVMYKFRSMVVDAEDKKSQLLSSNERDGPAFKIAKDPRVTRVGRFLRWTNIDELPQLWNVIRGDMSLVGPRPLPCDETAACANWQLRRLDVVPGIICTWQLARQRSRVPFSEWMRMDIRYIKALSPSRDVKLILRTFRRILCANSA
jgi:lipopolysaccharide/colanic/teichoic acid biosynthesis glycosyltransferase